MAAIRKIVVPIVAFSMVIICIWLYRLTDQLNNLKKAQTGLMQSTQFFQGGFLYRANETLKDVETPLKVVQTQWMAWPGFRGRERGLTLGVENLRLAYSNRLSLLEKTVDAVIVSARKGDYEESTAAVKAALNEAGGPDQSLQALSWMLDRLKVQDFNRAREAAQECVSVLSSQVPVSERANAFLTDLTSFVEHEKSANHATHARIASEVRNLISVRSFYESANFRPTLKGKAMIWDATKNTVEMAYELLPDNLRASSREGVVTILSVIRREQILQGHYSVSRQPAYKEKMTIGVVYWPEKVSAGTVIVWGGDPRQERPVSYNPEYGSSINIKEWVESLPKQ